MTLSFRQAVEDDVPSILDLLLDDVLGSGREGADMDVYLNAFRAMAEEPANYILVGERDGRIVAACQVTYITGLALQAARRVQVEGVRVASELRSQGIGEALIEEVARRARDAGCALFQLTMNKTRDDTARFYERLGFTPSHTGYKRDLS